MAHLTEKQKRFISEYLKDLNATQAAIRAGYSEKTAKSVGCENLTKPDIAAAIAKAQVKAAKRAEITVDSLAHELEEARALALKEKQSSAAVSATMGKAKLFGLGVENRRLSGTLQIVTITAEQLGSLTRDELALLEAAYPVLEKLGVVGGDTGSQGEA